MGKERWMDLEAWTPGWQLEAAERGFFASLHDGTLVLIRPVTPCDKIRIEEGLASMSPRSVYYRFGRQLTQLSDCELEYFTEVDQQRHIAWGAVDPEEPSETGLGIARLICESDPPLRAEVALTVIDSHHGLGLGTVLLATMHALAKIRGIPTVRACVLAENHAVVAWFERLGARSVDSDCQVILDWDLCDGVPETPSGQRLHALSGQIRSLLDSRWEGRA
jgi:GNAT superfamily N-acetyltransferase